MATYQSFLLVTKSLHGNYKNTYIINQRMKLYFVVFFFHPQTMSFVTMVTCDLTFVTRGS
jgi:hypothetical protein